MTEMRCGVCGGVERARVHLEDQVPWLPNDRHDFDPVPLRTCEHGVAGGYCCNGCSILANRAVIVPTREPAGSDR